MRQRALALRIEAQTFGQPVQAATAYRTEQELIAAAHKANLEITPELTREIRKQASEIASQAGAVERLKQARSDALEDLQTRQRPIARQDVCLLVQPTITLGEAL